MRGGEEALVGQDDELDAGPGKRQPPDVDRGRSGEVSGEIPRVSPFWV
jgi:hypothetical protein